MFPEAQDRASRANQVGTWNLRFCRSSERGDSQMPMNMRFLFENSLLFKLAGTAQEHVIRMEKSCFYAFRFL